METLANLGYRKCFYLGGGNSMHLLESASRFFECIPVVHEVTAAIATEYYNSENRQDDKAFALVTAGPGMTNLITGIAGAWLDSRELLVIGGQAKSTNLSKGTVRQIGHQEVDGCSIARPITKFSKTIDKPISKVAIRDLVSQSWLQRKGPVFLEICLDVSAKNVDITELSNSTSHSNHSPERLEHEIPDELVTKIMAASRPLLLLGGGVSLDVAHEFVKKAEKWKLPIACTWTGADRCNFEYPYFAGRPNTYGMRWANIFQQQSDLLIAVGTSLGYQQTGFNTEAFLPVGEIIHVDIDSNELNKKNPKPRNKLQMDSSEFIKCLESSLDAISPEWGDWAEYLSEIRQNIPTFEDCQKVDAPKISPQEVISFISTLAGPNDSIVAASSGGTFTATMQNYLNYGSQRLIGNKGLASMGYGLAGAIGISTARRQHRTILFEGDGGFAQNMQDLGTVKNLNLNLKMFITSNDGYASIRTSQKNYFDGHYLGCDSKTGLFLPNWSDIGAAFDIPTMIVDANNLYSSDFRECFELLTPVIFIISADPEQMYLPKIFSKVDTKGQMESTALHDMYPPLDKAFKQLFRYLPESLKPEFT